LMLRLEQSPQGVWNAGLWTHRRRSKVGLAEALTFHASFDHGLDADFARGDGRIYSPMVAYGKETGELVPGLGKPALGIADAPGRFGSALEFTPDTQ